MRRRYRAAGFLERCRRIRQALDLPAFTTDVIVGFPGETDADFDATCAVVREVGFSKIHVFSFSPREGTPAAAYPDKVPPALVAERRERLRALGQELAGAYQRQLVGRRLEVLVEGADPKRPGHVLGTSCRYAPVSLPGLAAALLARLVPVQIERAAEGVLIGAPVPDDTLMRPPRGPYARAARIALPLAGT
jgi:threonylcarbamoyladenosine tRNA methylthiotransferase MtaB